MEEQPKLALEPKIDAEDLERLIPELSRLLPKTECTYSYDKDGQMLSVLVRGSGVTTKFAVDLCTLNTTIDREGSYDLFKDDKDYTDISSKPLKSDDDIHQERKQAVRSALEELLNPTLIEE